MVSTQKKRNRDSQLIDFDLNDKFGNAANSGQENVTVNDGTVDREITVKNSGSIPTTKENTVNVQTLPRHFIETIDREMGKNVDTVEDRIQDAILTAIDNNVTLRSKVVVISINSSSGRDAASVTGNSEFEERIWITASAEKLSESNNKFQD